MQSKPLAFINQVTSITCHCFVTFLIIVVLRKNSNQAHDKGTYENNSGNGTFKLKFVETINLKEIDTSFLRLHRYDSFLFFFSILLIPGHLQLNPVSLNFIKNIISIENILLLNSSLIHTKT